MSRPSYPAYARSAIGQAIHQRGLPANISMSDRRCPATRSALLLLTLLPVFDPLRASRHDDLRSHEAFQLGGGPIHRLLDRFAALRAMGDHLGHGRLYEDLVADPRRRGCPRDRGDHVAARRIVVESALGRPLLLPSLEIVQFL